MTEPQGPLGLAFRHHDHGSCAGDALARAEAHVAARGARMTPVRRRTLEILLERHVAVGAYEVLDRLAESGFGRQPPVVYRALDFLVENGLAHRIQRLNAFMACDRPGEIHDSLFLICRRCNSIAEAPAGATRPALDDAARAAGFAIERTSIEVTGLCPACREEAS